MYGYGMWRGIVARLEVRRVEPARPPGVEWSVGALERAAAYLPASRRGESPFDGREGRGRHER